MVTIRLARGGAKRRPYFHITVADSRRARDGKYIERVGFFNPIASAQNDRLNINHERLDYWVSKGAQVTETVKTLIKQSKLSAEDFNKLAAKKEKLRLINLDKKKTSGSKTDTNENPIEGEEASEAGELKSTNNTNQSNNEDNLMEKTEDIIDKVAEATKDVAEEAAEVVTDVAEGAVDVAEELVETAENVAEDAVDAVKDVAEGAADVVEDVIETAEDVVEDAVDAVKDVAEGAADAVGDAVDAVKDAFTSEDSKDDK